MWLSGSKRIELWITRDELKSNRCLKVLAAGCLTEQEVSIRVASYNEIVKECALGRGMAIKVGDMAIGGSVSAILRLMGNLAPGYCIGGENSMECSAVESWMSFVVNSIEIPLEAMAGRGEWDEVAKDVEAGLAVVNGHLLLRTFMVGDGITLADISLACVCRQALKSGLNLEGNLTRWYDTVTNQDFFKEALGRHANPNAPKPSSGAALPWTGGIQMNGVAPAVTSNLFQRHRVRVKEILSNPAPLLKEGTSITVSGWARTTRNANKGQLLFIDLNDGSCQTSLQCVLEDSVTDGFHASKNCGGAGASFSLTGSLVQSPAQGQPVEFKVRKSTLLGPVLGGDPYGETIGGMLYPLSKKSHTLEHMRDNAHLRPRSKIHAAAMRLRHAMAYATHKFFHDHGFLYIHTPIVTCADAEGAGEQFAVTTMLTNDPNNTSIQLPYHPPPTALNNPTSTENTTEPLSKNELKRLKKQKQKEEKAAAKKQPPTDTPYSKLQEPKIPHAVDYNRDFFSRRANLTVSGQLNVETHACALSDVYTFGPTFRAENSHTVRHLAEFWMIEPEIAFANLEDDLNLAEDYLKYCVEYALTMCQEDLEFFENCPFGEKGLRDRLRNVLEKPFVRITYTEAIEILIEAHTSKQVTFEETPVWGMDLPSEMERYLCETVYKQPVALIDYPKDIKAFYMKLNEDGKTVAAADILVPKIGEIIGGSQREHRAEVLIRRCGEMGIDPKAVWWYLDLRRYGTVPHAGFGLGFERMILFITGLDNIRDVIPFPRWAGNAEF